MLKSGLCRGDVIAIANTKKVNSFALMLACIKIGVIYTNIDIDGPQKRLEKIFNICKPSIVFADKENDIVKDTSASMLIKYFLLTEELFSNNNVQNFSSKEHTIKVDG